MGEMGACATTGPFPPDVPSCVPVGSLLDSYSSSLGVDGSDDAESTPTIADAMQRHCMVSHIQDEPFLGQNPMERNKSQAKGFFSLPQVDLFPRMSSR